MDLALTDPALLGDAMDLALTDPALLGDWVPC
jgi:hypothetical protein